MTIAQLGKTMCVFVHYNMYANHNIMHGVHYLLHPASTCQAARCQSNV